LLNLAYSFLLFVFASLGKWHIGECIFTGYEAKKILIKIQRVLCFSEDFPDVYFKISSPLFSECRSHFLAQEKLKNTENSYIGA
jgi:hypothetical protein